MKAVVAAFNQEKALVGAFSVITNLRMDLFEALTRTHRARRPHTHTPSWAASRSLGLLVLLLSELLDWE